MEQNITLRINRATIVTTHDDVNDYFIAIDNSTGEEIGRRSTEDYGTWRYDTPYDFDAMVKKVAEDLNLTDYNIVYW